MRAKGSMSGVDARAERLREVAGCVEARRDGLVTTLVQRGLRVRALARREIEGTQRRLLAQANALTDLRDRLPVGTVALMLPSNTALATPLRYIGAALLTGNRVLVRFPSRTAWLGTMLQELLAPFDDAVRIVTASGPEFLRSQLGSGGADLIMAFGDDRWAVEYEDIVRRSRRTFIFEGPGKDPFLVLPGADLDRAAVDAVRGAFYNGGQACIAAERVYVHEQLLPGFLDRVKHRVERLVVGPAENMETDIAPFLNPRVVDRFLTQLTDAVAQGARMETPTGLDAVASPAPSGGTLLPPVVLTGVHHGMLIMREETFGPALAIRAVGSLDEAISLADDCAYGLAASVFGHVAEVAPLLRRTHGMVFENELIFDFFARHPLAPFGGRKQSGWVWQWRGDQFVRRDGPRREILEFSTPTTPLESPSP